METLGQPLNRLYAFVNDCNHVNSSGQTFETLSPVERRIVGFLSRTVGKHKMSEIQQTDEIYDTYARFLSFRLQPGLYIMDGHRIYTPVDSGHYEVYHLVSVPKESTPVYGISLLKFSQVFYSVNYIVIFVGCIRTDVGYRFLSSIKGFKVFTDGQSFGNDLSNLEHLIVPSAGVRPENELCYLFASALCGQVSKVEDDIDEEDVDSTDSEEERAEDYFEVN